MRSRPIRGQCPTYSEIPLALLPRRRLVRIIEAFQPDAMHIATEGPLGVAALEALSADRDACRAHAERYSWRACAEVFLSHLVPLAAS